MCLRRELALGHSKTIAASSSTDPFDWNIRALLAWFGGLIKPSNGIDDRTVNNIDAAYLGNSRSTVHCVPVPMALPIEFSTMRQTYITQAIQVENIQSSIFNINVFKGC